MVRIRLRRMGAKKKPFYRIVVADQRSPRDGRFIEIVGTYNPLTEPETVELKADRALHWLRVGAQPSEAVARLLRSANLLDSSGKPAAAAPAESTATAADVEIATPEAEAAEAEAAEAPKAETAEAEAA